MQLCHQMHGHMPCHFLLYKQSANIIQRREGGNEKSRQSFEDDSFRYNRTKRLVVVFSTFVKLLPPPLLLLPPAGATIPLRASSPSYPRACLLQVVEFLHLSMENAVTVSKNPKTSE